MLKLTERTGYHYALSKTGPLSLRKGKQHAQAPVSQHDRAASIVDVYHFHRVKIILEGKSTGYSSIEMDHEWPRHRIPNDYDIIASLKLEDIRISTKSHMVW